MNPVVLVEHDPSRAIGRVEAAQRDAKGLHIRARIPKPPPGSRNSALYEQIRSGLIRGLSLGGNFRRRLTALGPRAFEFDLMAVSVMPFAAADSLFSVVGGGKGLRSGARDARVAALARMVDQAERGERVDAPATEEGQLLKLRAVLEVLARNLAGVPPELRGGRAWAESEIPA